MKIKHAIALALITGALSAAAAFFWAPRLNEKPVQSLASESRDMNLGRLRFANKPSKETNLRKYLDRQWALKDINALKAWQQTQGSRDIIVAVCDTGIHTRHPCLKPNLWANPHEKPNNGIDDDNNGYVDDIHGWNFVANSPDIQDRHGHGTHISGIIAATGQTPESPGCQVIGVAPKVKIMTLKYYDDRVAENNVPNTVKCIDYAVQNGAHIINYSGGGPGKNENERAAIARANDKGVLFIAASGNESVEIEKKSKYFPASYNLPNIISVNSKNPEGRILDSSNWIKMSWWKREQIHNQTAPGEKILSTLPPRRYAQRSLLDKAKRALARAAPLSHNNYGYMTGTSQATGVSTGVAVLIKSKYPKWSARQIIRQMNNTGWSGGNEAVKRKTNQGKTLNAHEAITLRDSNMDPHDSPKSSVEPVSLKRMGAEAPAGEDLSLGEAQIEGTPFHSLKEIQEALKKK